MSHENTEPPVSVWNYAGTPFHVKVARDPDGDIRVEVHGEKHCSGGDNRLLQSGEAWRFGGSEE